jgi:hypothetical protein
METATNHQNAKFFTRKSALAGVIATLAMDCLSAMVHRVGLTAPLAPNLPGRYAIGIMLACLYIWVTAKLGGAPGNFIAPSGTVSARMLSHG